MTRSLKFVSVVALSVFPCVVAPASAQQTLATLRGRVVDEQHAVLPGATVTAVQIATNTTRTVLTGELGQYFLPNLPAGSYEATAELPGFAPQTHAGFELQVGQEVTLDFMLRVGGILEAVTVTSDLPALEPTKNTLGTIIRKDEIDDLPTVSRDFSDLALLTPGVTPGGGGYGASLSFNGQRGFANGFFVDGATAEWQYYGSQSSTFVQDWIQEFQVMTNSYPAEFGTASGGILNVITRSGTNQFHGRAYGFFRDASLDSAQFAGFFENGQPQFLDETAPSDQQRLGGFLGGPIVKDKVFFFGGLEWFNRDSSEVLALSDYWRARGVKTVLPTGTDDHPYLLKGDVNLVARHRLSVRYDRSVKNEQNKPEGALRLTEEARQTSAGPIWNIVTNLTSSLGNHTFNEFRVFYGSNKVPTLCNKSGTGGSAQLAIAPIGTFAQVAFPGAVFGCLFFSGLEGETNLHLTDNFSLVAGRHQLKVGVQLQRVLTIVDIVNFHDGIWEHPDDRAFDIDDPGSYPNYWIGAVGSLKAELAVWSPYFFVQDTWQVTDALTLNLGLRYDVDRSVTAGNEFVDAKNARLVARYGGQPFLEKVEVDYNNVAPRLGFVWTPTSDRRTTIRSAAGLFFDQNHNNFNVAYLNTLLSESIYELSVYEPFKNPFYDPADPDGSEATLRAFLARNYPYFPDLSQAPVSKERIERTDPHLQTPYTAQFTGGFSHEFGGGLSIEADYVYARGEGIPLLIDDNIRLVNGEYIQPDERFAVIGTFRAVGHSRYNALLAQARYRWRGNRVGMSYTLSKTTSNESASIFGAYSTNPLDLSDDEGPDDVDRRHNVVLHGSYLFPLDVQLAGIWTVRSALPYSVFSEEFALDDDPFFDWLEGRNSRRGDSENTVDFRVSKIVRLPAGVRITGFWEMFNAFNTNNFVGFEGDLESPDFGLPFSTLDKRRQQFGFRIDF